MSTRNGAGTAAVALCLLLCVAVVVWGFLDTAVVEKGLFAVWDRDSARRFLVFVILAAALLAAAARTRAPRAAFAVLAVLWVCFVFGTAAVLAVTGVFAAALGLGSVLAARAALRERFGRPLGAALSLVAGLAAILAALQVLVHFPVNTPSFYALLAGLAAVAGRSWLLDDARALLACLRAPVESRGNLAGLALILGVLALHTVHAGLPERMYDAVAMHLAIPTYVANHRQWCFDPWQWNWALMPMGANWLYTASFLLGGEPAVRLLNVGLQGVVVLLLYLELRERLPAAGASVLTALYSATPLAFLQSASLFVENTLSLMMLAAAVLLRRSWKSHLWPDGALLGLLVGASLATKLLAVFAAVALVPLALYSLARSLTRKRLALAAGSGALAALATGGVPYLYAWVAAGNPVLPMLNGVFRSPVLPPYNFPDTRWSGHLGPGFLFDATFRSEVFGELLAGSFGFQHLLLLPAGILALVLLGRRAPWMVALVGLVYCGGVLANTQYLRYLYPAFPMLALAEAEAVRRLGEWRGTARAVMGLALAAVAANLAFMPTAGWPLAGFHTEALFSSEARDHLLDQTLPQRRLLRVATALDGRNARILQIGNPVGLDLEGETIYTNLYNFKTHARLFYARSEEDVDRLVADYGVNYVLRDQTVKLPPAALSFLARRARPVRELGNYRLYRLRP